MSPKRIMVVDDSALVRNMLRETIDAHDHTQVVYAAPHGELALTYLEKHPVDLVVLDVEMPRMDGIEATRKIRAKWPRLPILMCSSLTQRGAAVTLRALSEGASDYIPKPNASYPKEAFTRELLEKIGVLLEVPASPPQDAKPAPVPIRRPPRKRVVPSTRGRVSALAIGSSTGGPNALMTMFKGLVRPLRLPMFIVQHMPPVFTNLLAERLAAESGQLVKEAEHGETVRHGVCYVAPGGRHMVVAREGTATKVLLNDDPQENFCRPAVDVLFRSLAAVYGSGVLASVLTGMGTDGSLGCVALADVGARILVQDPATCVVPSMPNGVLNVGVAESSMSIADIAREYERVSALRGGSPRAVGGVS